jgi:hypothetical protein
MAEKKKKTKKEIKARDLKPRKDAKGGYASRVWKPSPVSNTKARE